MDERIRAAERSGDRQRLLVELHRAGKPIKWEEGDKVVVSENYHTAYAGLKGVVVARIVNKYLTIIISKETTPTEETRWIWEKYEGKILVLPNEIKPDLE